MSEAYLQLRRSNLLNRLESENPNTEETIEQIAEINLALEAFGGGGSIDISTLAKEATLGAVDDKLPALSSGNIPVVVAERILTPDKRTLTANTTIPEGSVYVYMKVELGDVTIDGLTYSTGEFINYESCYPCLHPEIAIVIPSGKSVRLDRGF